MKTLVQVQFIRRVILIWVTLFLIACGEESVHEAIDENHNKMSGEAALRNGTINPVPNEARKVLAKVDDKVIYESDIEKAVQLKLYDLEWAKYEIKREALAEHVSLFVKTTAGVSLENSDKEQGAQGFSPNVDVLIEPPWPPRLDFVSAPLDDQSGISRPHKGSEDASIELSVFCNYQSIHCARMAPVYMGLNKVYPGKLRFVYYDVPQKFHRYSAIASQAARCADDFGQLDVYQSALWASQNNLKEERLIQLAKQVNIDQNDFRACMGRDDIREAIKSDMAFAEKLGFNNVPVTLVNGLYLNGPKSLDQLRYFIDKELSNTNDAESLRVAKNSNTSIKKSELPLRLEAISLIENQTQGSNNQGLSTATIQRVDTLELDTYRQDDQIFSGVFIVLIEKSRVIIENQGRLEFISLDSSSTKGQDQEQISNADTEIESNGPDINLNASLNSVYQAIPEDVISQDLEYKARPIVSSQGMLPLSKRWVDQQLSQQDTLKQGFSLAAHEVEGKHLLKLKGVEKSEFYQTLGLENGDAVMRINGEWVHEQHNNLFDVLEHQDHLSIVVMRKGLPVHLEYAIR